MKFLKRGLLITLVMEAVTASVIWNTEFVDFVRRRVFKKHTVFSRPDLSSSSGVRKGGTYSLGLLERANLNH
jgi:hypothetical protein